jgi:hypothetical protein
MSKNDKYNSTVKKEENKCAPGIDFDNMSCIPLYILIDMAIAYNKYNKINKLNKKIYLSDEMDIDDPDKYKQFIIDEFEKRFDKDHKEWLKEKFIEFMSDENQKALHSATFRPDGPQGKFDWLSTLDINKVLHQYEHKHDDFKFLGAVPIDFYELNIPMMVKNKKYTFKNINFQECLENGITKFGVVFNLDESWKKGSHWVSLFFDLKQKQIYFSDSYGLKPEKRIVKYIDVVKNFMNKYNRNKTPDIRYNKTQHQKGNSECGVYSINFIIRLLKGKTFDHLTKKRFSDEKVNICRQKYFENTK